ncbi:MAG: HD-GYP domain-containing protein [Clostridiales bacterium]|nr:HD-GYP domain-containing protein [Clostridiales bacterium]
MKIINQGDLMDGFKVFRSGESISVDTNKAGTFRLMVSDDDFEVFEAEINSGRSIICQPYESKDSLNVCFVLSGKLYHMNSEKYIVSGEHYAFKNLNETHYLSVVEKSKLLMIRNKGIFNEQISTMNQVMDLMAVIQEKDHYTDEHCNRTGNWAVQVAAKMSLNEESIENIMHAAKIHDVGKVKIPSAVLNKSGILSQEEYDIIKKHPEYGYDIIIDAMESEEIAEIVLCHHERINGSGYPKGLKGGEIPIESKIIAVIDSYDAMTTNRPYRKAFSKEYAIEELEKNSGILYDEEIINVFVAILNADK